MYLENFDIQSNMDNNDKNKKNNKMSKKQKKLIVIISISLISIAIIIATICGLVINDKNNKSNNNEDKYLIVQDEYLRNDIKNALNEINADDSKITDFKEDGNWAGGSKYILVYDKKITLQIMCNMFSTVDSINYNNTKIYQRGYEPYDIKNYLHNSQYVNQLITETRFNVKEYLSYPETAKFANNSDEWSASRYNNIYYISSYVKASNAYGVESKIVFNVGYFVDDTKTDLNFVLIYCKIDNDVKLNNINDYITETERKRVVPKNENVGDDNTQNGIVIRDGELGEYGEKTIMDGEEYIIYNIPAGKYKVTNKGNAGVVYVESNDVITNELGYMDYADIKTYRFNSGSTNSSIEIDIPKGYHLSVSCRTYVILEKIL